LQAYQSYIDLGRLILVTKWYIINVLSGYENKVVSLIKEAAEKKQVVSFFHKFIVPVESTIEVKKGKKN